MTVDNAARAIAALVSVASLAMVGIAVNVLRHYWNRFEEHFSKLSSSERKATGRIALPIVFVPVSLLLLLGVSSIQSQDYVLVIISKVILFVVLVALMLPLLKDLGVKIKGKGKEQVVIKRDWDTISYSAALGYMIVSVFFNIVALIGVSPTMLLINVGPFGPENFAWGRWSLFTAIFAFSLGIILFGTFFILDRIEQWKSKIKEEQAKVKGGEKIGEVKKKSESEEDKGIAKDTFEEHRFTNQNWVNVLHEIWKYAPNRYGRGIKGYDDSHPLAIRLKITGYELGLIASFLEEQHLIEYDQQQNNWIQITSKGFDVAMQNRNAERNDRINKGSLFLAFSIAIFAVVSLVLGIDDWLQRLIISIMISTAVIVGGFVIKRI